MVVRAPAVPAVPVTVTAIVPSGAVVYSTPPPCVPSGVVENLRVLPEFDASSCKNE